MSVKIRDTDRGYRKTVAAVKVAAKGGGVSIGVHAKEGAAEKKTREGDESMTVLDVAIINEFGLGVPERPFLRNWFDQNRSANTEALRKAIRLVLAGKMPLEQALELVGLRYVGGLQKAIAGRTLNLKENAPQTIAEKGSSTPLIDIGQLRQSLTHLVRGPKPPT